VEGEVVEASARRPGLVLLRLGGDLLGGMLPVDPLRGDGAGGRGRQIAKNLGGLLPVLGSEEDDSSGLLLVLGQACSCDSCAPSLCSGEC
jgi:hypothetical protein